LSVAFPHQRETLTRREPGIVQYRIATNDESHLGSRRAQSLRLAYAFR
jgi:hypothetical protein